MLHCQPKKHTSSDSIQYEYCPIICSLMTCHPFVQCVQFCAIYAVFYRNRDLNRAYSPFSQLLKDIILLDSILFYLINEGLHKMLHVHKFDGCSPIRFQDRAFTRICTDARTDGRTDMMTISRWLNYRAEGVKTFQMQHQLVLWPMECCWSIVPNKNIQSVYNEFFNFSHDTFSVALIVRCNEMESPLIIECIADFSDICSLDIMHNLS